MNATLDKPMLWSYREVANLLGLSDDNGYRLISVLAKNHHIPTQKVATCRCVDRAGLEALARLLNRDLNESRI